MRTSLVVALMIAVGGGLPVGAAIRPDAVVLALPFSEGEGDVTVDASGNGNHGSLANGAEWGEGKIGSGIRLRNKAHVAVASSPSLALADTDFTIAVWFTFAEQPGWTALMVHDVDEPLGWMKWSWMYSNGRFRFHADNTGGNLAWADSDFFEGFDLDRWYHLAVVKKGVVYTHYLDGEPFGVEEMDEPVPAGIDPPLTIGIMKELWELDGRVDEALISKQAFTQDDVRRHMQQGVQGVLPVRSSADLVSAWAALKRGM